MNNNLSDTVAIIDYGMGNIASVANMIKKIGGRSIFTKDKEIILQSSKIILPGVGAFDAGIQSLRDDGLDETLTLASTKGSKILGICLGFQLLFESSEEGTLPGLGLVKGRVRKFAESSSLRVPHMGWNTVKPSKDSLIFDKNSNEDQRFYFVHSYFADCNESDDIAATSQYGDDFVCAIEKKNILGVQFHPEKSHRFGINLFKRFLNAG